VTPLEALLASDAREEAAAARSAARRAIERLRERGVAARLVGSLARGDPLPHSDIDLLVVSCPPGLRYGIEGIVEEALGGRPFDVLYLDEVPPERQARLLAEAVDAPDLR
jgi:predicted nucleotidyltransferase